MRTIHKLIAILAVCAASSFAIIPEHPYEDPEQMLGYYAPNPDWRAGPAIAKYTANTRVPELVWVKYDGAWAQGMRLRRIVPDMLKAQIGAALIPDGASAAAQKFEQSRETEAAQRTAHIWNPDAPLAFVTNISVKVKFSEKTTNKNFTLVTSVGTLDTTKLKPTPARDGFVEYNLPIATDEKSKLTKVELVLPPLAKDDEQELTLIDFIFQRSQKVARFQDIQPRRWAVEESLGTTCPGCGSNTEKFIGNLYAYMNAAPTNRDSRVAVLDLPLTGFDRGTAEVDAKSYNIENIAEKIDGRDVPAVRFTFFSTPTNHIYLRAPFKFDAIKFHAVSLLFKIQVPAGMKVLGDNTVTDIGWFHPNYHAYGDNFDISFASRTHDVFDWNRFGVCRGGAAWMRQHADQSQAPRGWNVYEWDTRNDDNTGNKDYAVDNVTDWAVYYRAGKIPAGQKVVVTIANPRVASNLMRTGGDMDRYNRWKKEFAARDLDQKPAYNFLGAMPEGRLAKPLQIMRRGNFEGEIVVNDQGDNFNIMKSAIREFTNLIALVCAPDNAIPVLDKPSAKNNIKIFLGDWSRSNRLNAEQKKLVEADLKELKGFRGCAFRTFGNDIYLYGGDFAYRGNNGNFPGPAMGVLNGVFFFMEQNTDLIHAVTCPADKNLAGKLPTAETNSEYVFTRPAGGNWNIVWGDGYILKSPYRTATTYSRAANSARELMNVGSWHYSGEEASYGFMRQRSVNHWFGYGANVSTNFYDQKAPIRAIENDKWGRDPAGRRIRPACYTRMPCLKRVLEDAKVEYSVRMFHRLGADLNKEWAWRATDNIGLWLDDTYNICQCSDCQAPIRLPGGEIVTTASGDHIVTLFYCNSMAMQQSYNVYVEPEQRMENLAYFWQFPVPRIPVSRMFIPKLCPYIRNNYKVPIFAPVHHRFWKQYVRWSQLVPSMQQYEYALYMNFRPWCDIAYYDLAAEREAGVLNLVFESDQNHHWSMDRWVLQRMFYTSEKDPVQLRKFYCARAYREAADDMYKFYSTINRLFFEDPVQVDFDEADEHRLMQFALWHKAYNGGGSAVDELFRQLAAAKAHVKHPLARKQVEEIAVLFEKTIAEAKAARAKAGLK